MCDAVSFSIFEDKVFESIYPSSSTTSYSFHKNIFAHYDGYPVMKNSVIPCKSFKGIEQKTKKTTEIIFGRPNVGGKAEVTIEWGGSEGTTISGSVSGAVSDNKGNKAEVTIEVDDDGKGKATISAAHEEG